MNPAPSKFSKGRVEYITTAIVYPNSRIHVGWAWECLGADWLVRGLRLQGKETYFVTGADEHSINVQRAAQRQGLSARAYCDEMASDIQKVLRQMGISYDRFIRTSDPDHHRVVTELVTRTFAKGDIYLAQYEGHYCEGCEAFYTEKDLIEGFCPVHLQLPRWISEENYFFRLSNYQDQLLKLFQDCPDFLQPESRRAEVIQLIQSGLKDFSISRSSQNWGIRLPFQPDQVVYVWFDALINYLTAAGIESKLKDPESCENSVFDSRWPAKVHIIGKDISRFHCVYWPAMLLSLELPLPEKVFAHGYLNLRGQRLSKSSGNVIAPDDVMAVTGPDPFRYYLLAENQFSQDGNFSWESLVLRNNADLSNDFGNLINRSITMARKYFPDQVIYKPQIVTHSIEVQKAFENLLRELDSSLQSIDPAAYSSACLARSRVLNLYIDRTKPWALSKLTIDSVSKKLELEEVIYTLLEGVRWLATAFMPILPGSMQEVFRQLGLDPPTEQGALRDLIWGEKSYQPLEPQPIFRRLEVPEQWSS